MSHRGSRRARAVVAALLAAASIALAACGGSGGSGVDASGSPASTAVGKTIKIALNAPMKNLDPNRQELIQDLFVSNLTGATLTRYSSGPDSGAPDLAESFRESPDHRTWTATLRPGARFSDGSPITAVDVAATFRRILTEKAAVQRTYIPTVTSVTAEGRRRVVFRVDAPTPTLPINLSQPYFVIFPAAGLARGPAFFTRPVTSGRYTVDSFSAQSARLSLNPRFYGTKPRAERVEFSVTPDDGARLAQVQRGDANYAYQLPASLIPQIKGRARVQVVKEPGSIEMITNHERPLTGDVRIRQAISLGIDREAINRTVWAGQSTPTAGYWPSLFPYYDRSIPVRKDTEAARAQLEGTACESGCTIELMYFANIPWSQPTALILQQNLKEIGIDLKLDGVDEATAVERGRSGDFDIDLGPLTGLVAIPESLTPVNLQPSGSLRGGLTNYKSAEMDRLVNQLLSSPLDRRPAIAAQIEDLFAKDRPFVNVIDYGYVNATNLPDAVLRQDLSGFVIR